MRSLNTVNGFTLLEVIPSISLFAVFSTISLKVLLLVMQLQEKSDYQEEQVQDQPERRPDECCW